MSDPPLNITAPRPSFANSHSRSAFGFQTMTIPDTGYPQDITMAYNVDVANTMDEEDTNMAKEVNEGELY